MEFVNKAIYNILCLTRNRRFLNIANKISNIDDYNIIVPYVYLGNINNANNIEFLKKNNITAIINCTENEEFNEYFSDKPKFRLKVNDSKEFDNINNFKNQIINAIIFIDKHREEKKNIYIHCYWGLMRSATVVAGYLIYKYGLSVNDAINIVKEKRPSSLSSIYNFNEVLYYLESKYIKVLPNNNIH
jgi:protein-tyrosine phosphatase